MSGDLLMWTVYDHPPDYPDSFVARAFVIGKGHYEATDQVVTGATLDEVRAKLPDHLYNVGREPGDNSNIVETWL